ncbi:hypothetical protein CC2G_004447 [Coprinopsis cinerea AmutBmut pab1-1]|nr:hypothetical protein CC2G_004447 [Coprinopsis cinerea AmutBmut pab1-1]
MSTSNTILIPIVDSLVVLSNLFPLIHAISFRPSKTLVLAHPRHSLSPKDPSGSILYIQAHRSTICWALAPHAHLSLCLLGSTVHVTLGGWRALCCPLGFALRTRRLLK